MGEKTDPETRVVTLGDAAPTANQLLTPSQKQWPSDKLGGGYGEKDATPDDKPQGP